MKKNIIIILVLITVFIFLSCSNTQKTPAESGETTQEDNTPKINKMSKSTQQNGKVIYYYNENHPDFNGYTLDYDLSYDLDVYDGGHHSYSKWYVDEKKVEIYWKDNENPSWVIEYGEINSYNHVSKVSIFARWKDAFVKDIPLKVYEFPKDGLDFKLRKIYSNDGWKYSDGKRCGGRLGALKICLYSPKKN